MDKCFVDSSFWKALIDEKDDFYETAWKIKKQIDNEKVQWVTTNYIIDEIFTLVRVKSGLEKCRDLAKMFELLGDILEIVRVKIGDEENAWNWFWEPWSKLSFTDCTSFTVMRRLKLDEVLTFDEHFSKAGFKVWGR